MEQTPVHDQHNPDLLSLLPTNALHLIEIGCSSGSLAREYKKINPGCDYLGVEIDAHYAELARRHCDQTLALDIEAADDAFWLEQGKRDCWIFGDALEHLRDPWRILSKVRAALPSGGSVVACIPNAQHWSLQVRLCVGDLRYDDSGLLDRTHLRFFTRQTIFEMFDQAGLQIVAGQPRVFAEPMRDKFLPILAQLAQQAGCDVKMALTDAMPLQYVLRATPK